MDYTHISSNKAYENFMFINADKKIDERGKFVNV